MEHVPCGSCGCKNATAVARRADTLSIVRCESCGLCFLNPRPVAADIASLYAEGYYTGEAEKGLGYTRYAESAFLIKRHPPFGFDVVQRRLRPGMRTLDVGCAYGRWVYWMRKSGAEACGIDISSDGVNWGVKNLHCNLIQGQLSDLPETAEPFDMITLIDVIEHVPDLAGFLATVYRILKPGGLVFAQTPNWGVHARFGPKTTMLHISLEHLLYFESKTLDASFKKANLEVLEPARPVASISCDIEAYRHEMKLAQKRNWIRRVPGLSILRLIKSTLQPHRPSTYRDASDTEGGALVAWYQKPKLPG
jgi:2-polyprenyl-3-methyl-5-hydroxy-6-metoxy-1,4-benzoquinol methylase